MRILLGVVLSVLVLGFLAYWGFGDVTSLVSFDAKDRVSLVVDESGSLPFLRSYKLSGFGVSGSFEGEGFARVLLRSNEGIFVVADSSVSSVWRDSCIESCSLGGVTPRELIFDVRGGVLTLSEFHSRVFTFPTGLAVGCKDCQVVGAVSAPSPAVVLPIFWLLLAVVGALGVGRYCRSRRLCSLLNSVYVVSLILVVAMTGSLVFSGSGSSVFGIVALIVVLVVGCYEFVSTRRRLSLESVWLRK